MLLFQKIPKTWTFFFAMISDSNVVPYQIHICDDLALRSNVMVDYTYSFE